VGSVASSREVGQNSSLRNARPGRFLKFERLVKRVFDIAFSVCALAFISPLLLIIAVLIKVDSDGPILYVSERVGKDGKHFRFLKFRTMVKDAEALRGRLLHLNERQGILFKMSNDPRVTQLGRLLRRYSLDELPQFFSVLTGEMSVVGPRPCLPSEYERQTREQRRRVQVVPGITGLWQVEARSDPSTETYFKLDIQYVENWNLALDTVILMKTFGVVVAGSGE